MYKAVEEDISKIQTFVRWMQSHSILAVKENVSVVPNVEKLIYLTKVIELVKNRAKFGFCFRSNSRVVSAEPGWTLMSGALCHKRGNTSRRKQIIFLTIKI